MDNNEALAVTTTARETFSDEDHRTLARLIYRRFGNNIGVAASAWRRMLQNSCTDEQFAELVGIVGVSAESLLTQEERYLLLASPVGNMQRVVKMIRNRSVGNLKECLDLANRYLKEAGILRTVFVNKMLGRKLYRCEVEVPGGRLISQSLIDK